MRMATLPASLRGLVLFSVLVLPTAACGSDDDADTTQDTTVSETTPTDTAAETTPSDSAATETEVTPAGLPVGAACTENDACALGGPKPSICAPYLRPLGELTTPFAEGLDRIAKIGLNFPGGYCTSEPSCTQDADCGPGGACFAPFKNVTDETLGGLEKALFGIEAPNGELGFLKTYGLCLATCGSNADCRGPEYVCQLPLKPLTAVVVGAENERTFCVTPNECIQCADNARCDTSLETPACVCNEGLVGDGTVCNACDAHATFKAGTTDVPASCECNEGYSGDGLTCTAN